MKDWTGNNNSIWKTLGASNHTDKERQSEDFYATSPDAIDKLLKIVHPHKQIWECAAGAGHLSERLTYFGYNVYSTDIVERGYPLGAIKDFLTATTAAAPFDGEFDILTNPPYKYAKDFVLKALELLPADCHCYMFLKLTFLEGKARYKEIFTKTPPKAMYVFSERVLCAKNADFSGMRAGGGSAVAYAWYEWQKGYTGDTVVKWI